MKCNCGCEFEPTPLYDHLIICGDCTDKLVMQRLMGDSHYHLLITDPPCGVSYADKNKFLNALDRGNRIQDEIVGDHQRCVSEGRHQRAWRQAGVRNDLADCADEGA